ncbi:MAG: glutamine--fructose-6-phosphate transaminase (isomerizing), partial [Magnetovibrio sp.]|nr:glutamine--fructose-6-phosphate transaminase (isomerizing) [Magnetovibrio sp.]
MCGIIGIIGNTDVTQGLTTGLTRLEYRGYDSAGIAVLKDDKIQRQRAKGKLINLINVLQNDPIPGKIGIGHTRWATHGVPNEANAHPHATDRVAVVHNGIIENFQDLKRDLTAKGHVFASDTDTEAVVHLITSYLDEGLRPAEAVKASLARLDGAFALAIIFAGEHDLMIGARRGSPLAVGLGDDEVFLGSDAIALAHLTNRIMYLEDGDYAILSRNTVQVFTESGDPVIRPTKESEFCAEQVGKGGYDHFMLKEIYEQPQVIGDTLSGFINPQDRTVTLPELPFDLAKISRITLIACGTSFYACQTAKYWIEQLARIPVDVDTASEFRYRNAPLAEGGAALFVSQSGETADTLAALRHAKANGQHILSIINVPESTIARESDAALLTYAGPEVGVASTKAFTTQLVVLACLAIAMGRAKGTLDHKREAQLVEALVEVPARAAEVLNHDERLKELAGEVAKARDVLYLGRGSCYPIAMEGALKLKEISYIHAEGYAAGEMKHGPIALIDQDVPVIVIAPTDALFEKTASNMQEVTARGGRVIFMSDEAG